MANRMYLTISEAVANAPAEPDAAYSEINPIGPAEAKRAQLRAIVKEAKNAGLRVEIVATESTLADAMLSGLNEFEGAAIFPGNTDQPGYCRIKVYRPIQPNPAALNASTPKAEAL